MTKTTAKEKMIPIDTTTTDSADEYIFRFKLKPSKKQADPDLVLQDFYRDQIQDLFKVVFFSKNGEKILPNEFGFLNEQEKKYPLW